MAGRRPKTYIDTDKNHMPKAEQEARKNATPVYQSQEFVPPIMIKRLMTRLIESGLFNYKLTP